MINFFKLYLKFFIAKMSLRNYRLISFSKFLAIENLYGQYCQIALTRPFLQDDILAEYARLESTRRDMAELFNCCENLGRIDESTFALSLQEILNLFESVKEAQRSVRTCSVFGYNVLKHRIRLGTQVV